MEDEKAVQVQIGRTTYSLVEPPDKDSEIVKERREQFVEKTELDEFVRDLCNVGSFVRLAYHSLVAVGPDYTQMQLEVQDLGYDVTRLCDKSAIAVSDFKRAASTVVTDLQATYEYLLDNLEELALDTLESVSQLAGQMAEVAKTLKSDFEREATKVNEIAKRAITEKDEKKKLSEKIKAEKVTKEKEQVGQEELLKRTKQAEEAAEDKLAECEIREIEALEKLGEEEGLLTRIGHLFTGTRGVEYLKERRKTKESMLKECKKLKKEALERRKELEEKRQEAYQKMCDLTESIQNCRDMKDMSEKTVDALHHATAGLRMLAALMMNTAHFWEQLQHHCKGLGNTEVKQKVEKAMKYDEAKRHKVWTSNGFKIQAVQFYAGWVALNGVCDDYMLQIREARKTLYQYIVENPTCEEAEMNVKTLAREFGERLEKEKKSITEGQEKTEKELESMSE